MGSLFFLRKQNVQWYPMCETQLDKARPCQFLQFYFAEFSRIFCSCFPRMGRVDQGEWALHMLAVVRSSMTSWVRVRRKRCEPGWPPMTMTLNTTAALWWKWLWATGASGTGKSARITSAERERHHCERRRHWEVKSLMLGIHFLHWYLRWSRRESLAGIECLKMDDEVICFFRFSGSYLLKE